LVASLLRRFVVWLKLVRSGTSVTGAASFDGVNWTDVGRTTSPQIPSDALIGVAVTSHLRGVVATATFDSLSR
jgi:hypothetical protein